MGFLDTFSRRHHLIRKEATNMVSKARLHAAITEQMFTKLPVLHSVIRNRSDNLFYLTIGCITAANMQLLDEQCSADVKVSASKIIEHDSIAWDRDAIRYMEDCANFISIGYQGLLDKNLGLSKHDDRLFFGECLGRWVFWNITKHEAITDAEIASTRVIGSSIYSVSWWK